MPLKLGNGRNADLAKWCTRNVTLVCSIPARD